MTKLPQFPPSISIEVSSKTPSLEILEIAIDTTLQTLGFPNFKLDLIMASTMDYGTSLVSYDVFKMDKLDVGKLIYKRYQ